MTVPRRRPWLLLVLLQCFFLSLTVAQEEAVACDCTEQCTKLVETERVKLQDTCSTRIQDLTKSSEQARLKLEDSHTKEVEALERSLKEAKEAAVVSVERANSLRKEHDEELKQFQQQLEHDKRSCKEAHDHVVSLKQELVEEKKQLQQQVEKLTNQVEKLQTAHTHELNDRESKLKLLTTQNLESSRQLLHTNERLLKAEEQYNTTRINTSLLQRDLEDMLETLRKGLVWLWNAAHPWTSKCVEVVGVGVDRVRNHAVTKKAIQAIKDLYANTIQSFVEEGLLPLLKLVPVYQWHEACLDALASLVENAAHSLLGYVKVSYTDAPPQKVVSALEYVQDHSEEIVQFMEYCLVAVVVYWILARVFGWRGGSAARRQAKLEAGKEPKVKVE